MTPEVILRCDPQLGTVSNTLEVSVQHGRTTEISVRDGWVRFRRPDQLDVRLPAGSTWTPEFPSPQEHAALPPPAETPRTSSVALVAKRMPGLTHAARRNSQKDAANLPPVAVDEDQAYLELLALVREGRHTEARSAARIYLRHFPNAFRRAEIARVAEFGSDD